MGVSGFSECFRAITGSFRAVSGGFGGLQVRYRFFRYFRRFWKIEASCVSGKRFGSLKGFSEPF